MNVISNMLKSKKIRNLSIAITAVIIVILVWFGFSSANTVDAAVETETTVVSLDIAETVEASGSLEAQPFASLDWKTSGVVEIVNVKSGDTVKADNVLLTLQPDSTSACSDAHRDTHRVRVRTDASRSDNRSRHVGSPPLR